MITYIKVKNNYIYIYYTILNLKMIASIKKSNNLNIPSKRGYIIKIINPIKY